ncbi:hemerythrin domain-containing protein [Treponema phagedenis]|uniref:hemerythrin domain-containing protein n=1 Tax=Treponema phagedenis TaxID=162 RepID=UPI0001F64062|nr:hemerythrin domain-containing protein [Treponema phagedenis]EFW39363.1 hypothetical protein HMPREF9554_00097 [Treponema phagedenis F0421]TYT78930.1 hemerythrin domain-containing protein [Treponema phagedenis]
MDSIELMIKEHENILKFISVIRKACCRILEGAPVPVEDFTAMISFARTYADTHHHGKEEEILFHNMIEHIGQPATGLIQHGMLVEHDMGRFFISRLEEALTRYAADPNTENKLDIIMYSAGWADLLTRHIEKENKVAYVFARRELPPEVLHNIDKKIQVFEQEAAHRNVQEKSLQLLKDLTAKYC